MIDLITFIKTGLTDTEKYKIIENNNLQTNSKAGKIYFDNENLKFNHAYYLRIETKEKPKLKLECSLHKYFNHLGTGKQTNFDLFSFSNAKNTIKLLAEQTGLDIMNMNVSYYEIGLNLNMNEDCRKYIDQMRTIGILDSKRQLFVNPKYKDERIKITVFHRHIKKVYKVYDKVFEMNDKRRNDAPGETANILRIETIYRRVEKTTVAQLLTPESIKKLTDRFITDWRTVQFEPIIQAPKGTHQKKIDLCKSIILFSPEYVLKKANEDFQNGKITYKQHRNIREFINNEWINYKNNIKILKPKEEIEYRAKLTEMLKIAKR